MALGITDQGSATPPEADLRREQQSAVCQEPGRATDAAGSRGPGAQGRAAFTPETTRRHIGLYAMAVEGMPTQVPSWIGTSEQMIKRACSPSLSIVLARAVGVWVRIQDHGPDGVRSIQDARDFRMLLGATCEMLDGLHHDTRFGEQGYSLMDIAEIRVGIRDRNGSMKREWM